MQRALRFYRAISERLRLRTKPAETEHCHRNIQRSAALPGRVARHRNPDRTTIRKATAEQCFGLHANLRQRWPLLWRAAGACRHANRAQPPRAKLAELSL